MEKRLRKFLSVALCLFMSLSFILSFAPFTPQLHAQESVIFNDGFEDGNAMGWKPNYGTPSLTVTDEEAQSGKYSLRTTNRTSTSIGPAKNITSFVIKGKTYTFSAWIRVKDAPMETERIRMNIRKKDDLGNTYTTMAAKTINKGEWFLLTGTYQHQHEGSLQQLDLYFESNDSAETTFYIDDIVMTGEKWPPIFNDGFEDGTRMGWTSFANPPPTLAVTDEQAQSGTFSLLTTNRAANFAGPSKNITNFVLQGKTYSFSAWVRVKDTPLETERIRMNIKKKDALGNTYTTIAAKTVNKGEWFLLSGTYQNNYEGSLLQLDLYFESNGSPETTFYIDNIIMEGEVKPPVDYSQFPSLKDEYKDYFPIGTSVSPTELQRYEALIARNFNILTTENAMKWDNIHPEKDRWNWDSVDQIVNFAGKHQMKVRGHVLIYGRNMPDWVFLNEDGSGEASRDLILQRMEQHIKEIMTRYKGRIYAYDAINELVTDQSAKMTRLMRIVAPDDESKMDFLTKVFRWAREADPDALLIYDEIFGSPTVTDKTYDIIKDLLQRGAPIDGIGMQTHVDIYEPAASTENVIKKLLPLGLKFYITEMDMSVFAPSDTANRYPNQASPEILELQAQRYGEYFDMFRKYKEVIAKVSFWNVTDATSWLNSYPVLRSNYPLLFDREGLPKPAFYRMLDFEQKLPRPEPPAHFEPKSSEAVRGTPIVDGDMDPSWEMAQTVRTDQYVSGNGAYADVRTMWDEDHLYVLLKVRDMNLSAVNQTPYLQDSIELFLDENNGKTNYYENDDAQYRVNYKGEKTGEGAADLESLIAAAKVVEGGYIIEMAIPFQTTKGEIGKTIGVDFQVNDDPGTGTRESIAKWSDPTNDSWRYTSKWGNVKLVGRPDDNPPHTTAAAVPAPNSNGWNNDAVTVTLSAADHPEGSGVKGITYKSIGAQTVEEQMIESDTAAISITNEGMTTVEFFATDYAGNEEAVQSVTVSIDKTAPVITLIAEANDNAGDLHPQISVTDELSGVDEATTRAALDGNTVEPETAIPLYTLELGEHEYTVWSSDLAGNIASQTFRFQTAASIDGLKALVQRFESNGWIDNAGIANSLLQKLEAGNVKSFIHEIEAQAGKHISNEAANYLLRDARAVSGN